MKIKEDFAKDAHNITYRSSLKDIEQHKVLFSEESSSLYSSDRPEARFKYDYEVNSIRFGEEKEEERMYIKSDSKLFENRFIPIDPSEDLYDTIHIPYNGDQKVINPDNLHKKQKANIFKYWVSKKKRRTQTPFFDLDLCYIT